MSLSCKLVGQERGGGLYVYVNPLTRSALEMTQDKGVLGFGLDEPSLYPSLMAPCKGGIVP